MTLFQTIILASTFPGTAVLELQSQVQQPAKLPAIIATNSNSGNVTVSGSSSGVANGFRSNPVSGFAPNPVGGFNPNPVGGFNANPVGGFNANPVRGFNANPVRGFNANPVSGFRANPVNGFNSNLVQGFVAPVTAPNENPETGLSTLVKPQATKKPFVIVAGALPITPPTNSVVAPVSNTNAVLPRF